MKTWVAAAITIVMAGGVSAMVEVAAGDAAADTLTSNDSGVDRRIVIVNFDAGTSVDGADSYLSFDGSAYNSVASLAAASGARAIGFVDFDSLAFGDGGSDRALVVGSVPIASMAVIPFLGVAIDRNVGGVPLVTDYRLDLLANETAGVGLPTVMSSRQSTARWPSAPTATMNGASARSPSRGSISVRHTSRSGTPLQSRS